MPQIRLLVSVAGDRGEVRGNIGDVLTVDGETARKWCDGERAERVIDRTVTVEKTVALNGATAVRRVRHPRASDA